MSAVLAGANLDPSYIPPTNSVRICSPSVFQNGTTFSGRYPVADGAFDRQNYKVAFRAYYQYFFCLNDNSETVNPAAEDSGAAQFLRHSLELAIAGDLKGATVWAQRATRQDGRFCEATFITADLLFAQRRYKLARHEWASVESVPGYPVSSGSSTAPCASAAKEMLKRHLRSFSPAL